jgi:hypothetical protein
MNDLAVASAVEPVAVGLARADGDRRDPAGASELEQFARD